MSRDILSPPITVLGKRRYRVNVIRDDYGGVNLNPPQKGYQEDELFGDDDDDTYEVEELGNSTFKSSFHVPRVFYGGLIGQKGMTKRRIESESKTEITIPGVRATGDSLVVVKGKSRKDVCAGRRRIELVIESLRRKTKPTHFTCAPACTEEMKRTFNIFKQSVLADDYPGTDELLFTNPEKIHITFATCALLDDEERVKAAQILTECREFVANKPPIEVTVRGLEIMNDDPSSVSVLYARVESSELQILADRVLKKIIDARLSNEERDGVKLHMTVMKALNRSRVDPTSSKTFDARNILKKYADFEFGKFKVMEIHLSQMHTTGENGFYVATGIITV